MAPAPVFGCSGAPELVAELARQGVADARVLGAIGDVPRHIFVPATFARHAWDNVALPIGHGQTISQPLVVAMMTEALQLGARHNVLEIGTGSGYQTAILSRLCRRVFTIERHRALMRDAESRFKALGLRNIINRFGDGTKGWPESGPFDRILVTAAAENLPEALVAQLAPGGIMVVPVGPERRDQELVRIRRRGDAASDRERLAAVRFVPLVSGLPRPAAEQGELELTA